MIELKCKECGAIISSGTTECPSCGCPVETQKDVNKTASKQGSFIKLNLTSVISLLLGIIIIVMGIAVMNTKNEIETYHAKNYDASYKAFGADFYTEIYAASDTIVDELDDINGGIAHLSETMVEMANLIYYPTGMMITAIGLGVVALSIKDLKKQYE